MRYVKPFMKFLAWMLGLGLVALLILWLSQNVLMYPSSIGGSGTDYKAGLQFASQRGFTQVSIPGVKPATEFRGVWIASGDGVAPTVLWFHGRDEVITGMLGVLVSIKTQGLHCLAVEYPSYGDDTDELSEKNIMARAEAAYEYLEKRDDVAPRGILSGGYELGGSVAIALAGRKPVAGVLSVATLPDMSTAVAPKLFGLNVGFVLRDSFDTTKAMGEASAPVLLVHGSEDPLVPLDRAEALRAAGRRAKLLRIDGAGRTDIFGKMSRDHWEDIGRFLLSPR